MLHHLKQVI